MSIIQESQMFQFHLRTITSLNSEIDGGVFLQSSLFHKFIESILLSLVLFNKLSLRHA